GCHAFAVALPAAPPRGRPPRKHAAPVTTACFRGGTARHAGPGDLPRKHGTHGATPPLRVRQADPKSLPPNPPPSRRRTPLAPRGAPPRGPGGGFFVCGGGGVVLSGGGGNGARGGFFFCPGGRRGPPPVRGPDPPRVAAGRRPGPVRPVAAGAAAFPAGGGR